MTNSKLYLVGTVHIDIDGKKRLDTLLEGLSPDIIALEMSGDRDEIPEEEVATEKDIKKVQADFGLTRKEALNLAKSAAMAWENRVFELRSSKEYIIKNPSCRLEYMDISVFQGNKEEFEREMGEGFEKEIDEDEKAQEAVRRTIQTMAQGPKVFVKSSRRNMKIVYKNQSKISQFYEKTKSSTKSDGIIKAIYNPERDKTMTSNIKRLYNGSDKLIAIVGLGHLYSIAIGINDLDPTVFRLDEYRKIINRLK